MILLPLPSNDRHISLGTPLARQLAAAGTHTAMEVDDGASPPVPAPAATDGADTHAHPHAHGDDGGHDDDDPAHRLVLPGDVVPLQPGMEVLEHIGTAGQKVTVIDGLESVASTLRVLVLRSNLVRRMTGVGALPHLVELELYDNKVEALEDLEGLAQLATLDMSYNRVPAIGGALRGARALRTLYLAANKIARIEGLEDCAALEVLDLGANAIRVVEGLAGCCGALRELYLGKNKIARLAPGSLAPHLGRLKKLDLQSNRLTAIEGLEELPELEELYLGHNGITEVTGLAGCPKLAVLDLTANRVAQLGDGLDGLTALTDLWLGSNRIATFESVLPALARLPALSAVYLEHNPLAGDFEYRLRLARELPRLAQIDATPVLRRD